MTRLLSHAERLAWARLARTPRISPVTFAALLNRFSDPSEALDALAAIGAQWLCAGEPAYPALLRALEPGPPMIAVRGDPALLHKPTIALVGAREASAPGLKLARMFAAALSEAGFVVVSGLARGIDAEANAASLSGGTVAVLAGGLDRPYPPQNLPLYEAICAQGCVVAEAPLGFQARARDFPRRNHLISGLSQGVVVIEAAVRSGSLITAHAAADQGREVFAVPGSPLDHRFRGANALIKGGATLVESADDVIEALSQFRTLAQERRPGAAPLASATAAWTPEADDPALARRLAGLLSPTPVHINDLARLSGADIRAVSAAVVELEMLGTAASLPGGYVAFGSSALADPSSG